MHDTHKPLRRFGQSFRHYCESQEGEQGRLEYNTSLLTVALATRPWMRVIVQKEHIRGYCKLWTVTKVEAEFTKAVSWECGDGNSREVVRCSSREGLGHAHHFSFMPMTHCLSPNLQTQDEPLICLVIRLLFAVLRDDALDWRNCKSFSVFLILACAWALVNKDMFCCWCSLLPDGGFTRFCLITVFFCWPQFTRLKNQDKMAALDKKHMGKGSWPLPQRW